jgi:hypothetical protein
LITGAVLTGAEMIGAAVGTTVAAVAGELVAIDSNGALMTGAEDATGNVLVETVAAIAGETIG